MKQRIDMQYNSQLEILVMPEYGRNIHHLVQYAKTLPTLEQRQAMVEEIIQMILTLYPQSKSVEDYRDKLWKHIFKIAEYDLDVTPPNGEIPTPEDDNHRPERIPYPVPNTKFRHYGVHVQQLIKKGMELPEGPVRDGMVQVIASYMKLAYRTWNKEHFVTDDVIKDDLKSMSNGVLSIEDTSGIDDLANSMVDKKKPRGYETQGRIHDTNKNRRNLKQRRKRK